MLMQVIQKHWNHDVEQQLAWKTVRGMLKTLGQAQKKVSWQMDKHDLGNALNCHGAWQRLLAILMTVFSRFINASRA